MFKVDPGLMPTSKQKERTSKRKERIEWTSKRSASGEASGHLICSVFTARPCPIRAGHGQPARRGQVEVRDPPSPPRKKRTTYRRENRTIKTAPGEPVLLTAAPR